MQCWIAANVLSKWVEKFEQVSGWLLFILGCLNLLVVSNPAGHAWSAELTLLDPLGHLAEA